jgi:hypothetical protein
MEAALNHFDFLKAHDKITTHISVVPNLVQSANIFTRTSMPDPLNNDKNNRQKAKTRIASVESVQNKVVDRLSKEVNGAKGGEKFFSRISHPHTFNLLSISKSIRANWKTFGLHQQKTENVDEVCAALEQTGDPDQMLRQSKIFVRFCSKFLSWSLTVVDLRSYKIVMEHDESHAKHAVLLFDDKPDTSRTNFHQITTLDFVPVIVGALREKGKKGEIMQMLAPDLKRVCRCLNLESKGCTKQTMLDHLDKLL